VVKIKEERRRSLCQISQRESSSIFGSLQLRGNRCRCGRAWITFNGIQIANFETIPNLNRTHMKHEPTNSKKSPAVSAARGRRIETMQSNYKQLVIFFSIALVTLIVCARAGVANETTVQKQIRHKSLSSRATGRRARKSQLISHKNAKVISQKTNSPQTSLHAETTSRRQLQSFFNGKSKSYKGLDLDSDKDF
jgi:hypothetical protein